MASVFPTRYVDKTDPGYREVPRYHFVLKPSPRGNTLGDYIRTMGDIKLGIEHAALDKAIPHVSDAGQSLTLDSLKNQITQIISENPPEWIRGCDGVFIIHHPDIGGKLVSIFSPLLASGLGNSFQKLLSVCHEEETFVFELCLQENRFLAEDSIIVGLRNPSDPAAECVSPSDGGEGLRFNDIYADRNAEPFAINALLRDLVLNRNYLPSCLAYRYEPLGATPFPDFELIANEHEWGVEVTRIESEMVFYFKVEEKVENGQIERAVRNRITDSGIAKALRKALSEKTEKRYRCSRYSRYCLLLVDTVDSVGGKDSAVWNGIDLSAFDAIALVKLDGSLAYIKGGNAFSGVSVTTLPKRSGLDHDQGTFTRRKFGGAMTIPDQPNALPDLGKPEPALLHGRLVDVDVKRGTAILNAYVDSRIPLRFDASLEQEMLQLEQKFVNAKGHGWFNDQDRWIAVVVEEISRPAPPRTAEEILNDPNPKIFDPAKVPVMDLPDEEWEAFHQALLESRGRREP